MTNRSGYNDSRAVESFCGNCDGRFKFVPTVADPNWFSAELLEPIRSNGSSALQVSTSSVVAQRKADKMASCVSALDSSHSCPSNVMTLNCYQLIHHG